MEKTRQQAKVARYTEIAAESYGDEAPGVSIRWLIDDEHDGAPVYILRMIEIQPGGSTPDHMHEFEHETFVFEGSGEVRLGGDRHAISAGDVIFVPSGMRHSFSNAGGVVFRLLCGIPVGSRHDLCGMESATPPS